MDPAAALARVERVPALDPLVSSVKKLVDSALSDQRLRDQLHGTWLGHPLHPMLTDVPIGAWTSAAVLDLLPGTGHAAGTLIATGIAAALPTAVTGLVDWSELQQRQQRVGLVHALANVAGVSLYAASLFARLRRKRVKGRALAFAGLGAVSIGGYVGGHLSYREAAGVNHTQDLPDLVPGGWQQLGALADLPDGKPVKRSVGNVELFVYRQGEQVHVLAEQCSHLSGPLSEGEVADGCVTCPWHGSTFRISDGAVVHGPTTAPQPVFETRVLGGLLEVRLAG